MNFLSTPQWAAMLYMLLALVAASVQYSLACGARLGHLTLGGYWPKRLPRQLRPVAGIQGTLLLIMGMAVLDQGGVIDTLLPVWSFDLTVLITGLSLLANVLTPSKPERRLWAPVLAVMLVAAKVSAG